MSAITGTLAALQLMIKLGKDGIQLSKEFDLMQFKKRLIEAEEQAFETDRENESLKRSMEKMKERLRAMTAVQGKVHPEDGVLKVEGDKDPLCRFCYETEGELIHLFVSGAAWECGACKNKGTLASVIRRFNDAQRARKDQGGPSTIRTRY